MKKVIAYVHSLRVHWLVEELEGIGIKEIMVTEYFNERGQISRFEFLCEEDQVEQARSIVHRIGSNGSPSDHFIEIHEFSRSPVSADGPLRQRISRLEE